MRNKINVLVIDNSLDITGAFNAIWYCVLDLKEEVDFTFLIPEESKNDIFLSEQGFSAYKFPMKEISKNMGSNALYFPLLFSNALRLRKILEKHSIDIVHANDLYNMVGLVGRFGASYKLLTHIRRLPNSFPSLFFNSWMALHEKFADAIVGVSTACFVKSPTGKSQVIYDRLPLQEKYPLYEVQELREGVVKLIYLANFTFGKGQNHAVEALARVVKKCNLKNVHLTFAGGDFGLEKNRQFKQALIDRAGVLEINRYVSFEDKVVDVERKLKEYDIALNFSDSESFSYTCLEALHYGVPLIATDSGGPRELFEDQESGILVPVQDIDKMAQAIVQLATNVNLRKKFSENSREFVRSKFSKEQTSEKLGSLYKELKEQQN
ncbi:glycosyltransferase family 4 protein [Rufibacter tibetensis]|uniref:Glycosyl transferase family 1 domain-containing protein n=1 Tax=Rufibacter tibetensis TaxID=512763 RepID=A0A0P0CWM7_9BACT|nr:glycosyltransferase family 4 protein [Rufibacter tibetensis]ALI99766.1 hypothetical protein DC20_13270 [Rufibacter tibetensis]